MSELKRNINTPHKRGFYVRMKISSNKHKKNIYYFYFKWLLWGSLSLYFFTSYFIASSKNPSLSSSPTPPSNQTTKQPLSVKPSKSQLSTNPIIKFGDLGDLKVYVYDLPPKYNSDWLRNNRCEAHLFAAEVAIHKALMSSDVRTLDPIEADFFFVPVYVSCNFSTVNGFPSLGHARPLLNSAIQLVSSQMPYWNRSDGSDHVFVASHDYGACFHATEDVAIKEGIPGFLKNSIILQTFGVKFGHPCQEVEHVLIPPYVSPQKISSTIAKSKGNGKRDIFVFFRGKMEVHPKNINGRYYSK
ncbi:hypothetical protein GIB67_017994 [Kingdonia uniflora]|uniref:Exostosin GT47 domain-containing protein n=1 Tax=Kingdonia uniflora TaxID=39325 RepID=A0A7J7NWN5_9MAGN|nr:hypothetical protein GIB67_017994 [Kingdonia uniflora]